MSRSNRYCSVPQCSSWEKKNPEINFHAFPKAGDKKYRVLVEGKSGSKVLMDRQKAWKWKLKIDKPITENMKVCSLHFTKEDYFYRDPKQNQRKFLKKTAVPSQNLPAGTINTTDVQPGVSNNRSERLRQRCLKKEIEVCASEVCPCEDEPVEIPSQEEIEAAEGLLQLLHQQPNYQGPKTFRDFEIQVNTPKVNTLCDFLTTNTALNSFTGLNNKELLDTIVEAVQTFYNDQRSHRLSIKERIVLVLTKLKCDLSYITLSILFGVSQELCKKYIYEMLPILSRVLSAAIRFPEYDEVQKNMPICFENFQNVRVVLDCTEISIQKAKCPKALCFLNRRQQTVESDFIPNINLILQ